MKRLKERTEIAKAMNFGKYPVLTIDLKDRTEYGLKGCKVRIDFGTFSDGEKFYEHGELYVYSDEKKFKISSWGCDLHASFGYSDIEEMLDYANAPIIKADEDIVIVVIDSVNRQAYAPYILHTGKIHKFCTTPIDLEPVDASEYFL